MMMLLFNLANVVAWVMCFVWMHRISTRQDTVLKGMADQTRRIERLSKAEHDLIKEVHPVVGAIKDRVEEVAVVVHETSEVVKEGPP